MALNGPRTWLMTKIRARQRVAVLFCSSAGMNQSVARIKRSVFTTCFTSLAFGPPKRSREKCRRLP